MNTYVIRFFTRDLCILEYTVEAQNQIKAVRIALTKAKEWFEHDPFVRIEIK